MWSNHHFSVAGKHCRSLGYLSLSKRTLANHSTTSKLDGYKTSRNRAVRESKNNPIGINSVARCKLIGTTVWVSSAAISLRLPNRGVKAVSRQRFSRFGKGQLLGEKSRSVGQFKNVLWANTRLKRTMNQVWYGCDSENEQRRYEKNDGACLHVARECRLTGIQPNCVFAQAGKQSGCFPCHAVKISRVAKKRQGTVLA